MEKEIINNLIEDIKIDLKCSGRNRNGRSYDDEIENLRSFMQTFNGSVRDYRTIVDGYFVFLRRCTGFARSKIYAFYDQEKFEERINAGSEEFENWMISQRCDSTEEELNRFESFMQTFGSYNDISSLKTIVDYCFNIDNELLADTIRDYTVRHLQCLVHDGSITPNDFTNILMDIDGLSEEDVEEISKKMFFDYWFKDEPGVLRIFDTASSDGEDIYEIIDSFPEEYKNEAIDRLLDGNMLYWFVTEAFAGNTDGYKAIVNIAKENGFDMETLIERVQIVLQDHIIDSLGSDFGSVNVLFTSNPVKKL